MSIYYSGGFRRSSGVISAVIKQIKQVNLKAVNRITVTFDPFSENAKSAREFLFHLSTPKISATNPKCILKSDIVCARQPSEIKFTLNEAQDQIKTVKFLSDNLTTLELLQLCNKHISVLAPKEEAIEVVKTKSEKKQTSTTKKVAKKK